MNFNIKGFHLRNRVDYRGHEGEPLAQADLYLKEPGKKLKKVGFLSDGDWGGPDVERFESKEAKEKYIETAEEVYNALENRQNIFDARQLMKEDLFALYEIEQGIRKDFKVKEMKELDLQVVLIFKEKNYGINFYDRNPLTDTGINPFDLYYRLSQKRLNDVLENKIKNNEEYDYYKAIPVQDLMKGKIDHYTKKNIKVK